MKNTPDLSNKRFGLLVVLSQSIKEFKGRRQSVCLCLCDCGNKIEIPAHRLQKKDGTAPKSHYLSCGCARTTGDISGKKFGRLTAIEAIGKNKKGEIMWQCICDCGGEKIAPAYQLVSGMVKSCGCLSEEHKKRLADMAFIAAKAAHSRAAEAKRVITKYGAPESAERCLTGERLREGLHKANAFTESANIAAIIKKEPQGLNKYRGVYFNKSRGNWFAACRVNGVTWRKYGFKSPEEAKKARDKKQAELIEEMGLDATIEKRIEYVKSKE